MTLSTSFSSINSLSDYPIIAGTTYTLKFTVINQSGSAIDLSGASCAWKMASFGTDFAVVSKTGSVIATNIFSVILSPSDTINLAGKFSHQPIITFANGSVVKPAQGIITIIKGIS